MAITVSWVDHAKRAYDHSFGFDPIVRTLADTDFYKLLMHQFIWRNFRDTDVSFKVTNRTKSVYLTDEVDMAELRRQLDHVQNLKWENNFLVWLAGNTFYGQEGIFSKDYLDYLRNSFRLSDYSLRADYDLVEHPLAGVGSFPADHKAKQLNGQFVLTFTGSWVETTMWEIYALTIINELRYRKKMREMPKWRLDVMYSQAKVKLFRKLQRLDKLEGLNLSDFGTRRRHSFLWQEYCVQMAGEILGPKFTGTSNAYLAFKHGLEAKGTNAHELPMVLAGLAETDDELRASQYRVLELWQNDYRGNLLVCLPDTFGTTQFLRDAPEWLADWTGFRPDSKEPIEGGEELISYWKEKGRDPKDKLILFSDGLDVAIDGFKPNGTDIVDVYNAFHGTVRDGYGWGTMLTNDFIGCDPAIPDNMKPISLVCKVSTVNGRSAVKLSDNYNKATGSVEEIERYRRVFGTEGQYGAPTLV